jgi:hypothetical protein
MFLILAVSVVRAQTPAPSIPVTVDCSSGQSLNRTLAKLNKLVPTTVSVNGTCSEYIQVFGFENLKLQALPGAALVQPSTSAGNLFNAVLLIESSRSVTVSGFSVQADTSTVPAIGIGHGSTDIRLRNLNVQGGTEGILVFENTQVSLAYVNGKDPGYTPLGIYDSSDVHVEHCFFENTSGALWHAGIDLGASHLTIYATTIRNMQVGINAGTGSVVDAQTFTTYNPISGSTSITIDNPAGTSFDGVTLSGGASLNVFGAGLVIDKPGQSWGGTTGGVQVTDRSVLYAPNSNLSITGSHGQGIVVVNNSHATITGATITGSGHGGLVASNQSSIDVAAGTSGALTLVGGSAVDLFCDANSTITGNTNLAGVPTAQCSSLLAAEFTVP